MKKDKISFSTIMFLWLFIGLLFAIEIKIVAIVPDSGFIFLVILVGIMFALVYSLGLNAIEKHR